MSIKDELEVDIKRFFEQIENQDCNGKAETLRLLMDKYIHLTTTDYMMDKHDLDSIVSMAKNKFATKTFPVHLGDKKRKVYEAEQANLCIIESTVGWLNKKDCLKRLAKFDYREDR